jgi:hypothetical protein
MYRNSHTRNRHWPILNFVLCQNWTVLYPVHRNPTMPNIFVRRNANIICICDPEHTSSKTRFKNTRAGISQYPISSTMMHLQITTCKEIESALPPFCSLAVKKTFATASTTVSVNMRIILVHLKTLLNDPAMKCRQMNLVILFFFSAGNLKNSNKRYVDQTIIAHSFCVENPVRKIP